MKLTIYTDDNLTEVARVVEADKVKIPYKVSMYIIQSFDGINLDDTDAIFNVITKSADKLDKIIKATFNVSDSELECVDTSDLIDTAMELYKWGITKIASIKGGDSKNV